MDTRASLLLALCFVAIATVQTLSRTRDDVEVEEHRLAPSTHIHHGSAAGESSNKWKRSVRETDDKKTAPADSGKATDIKADDATSTDSATTQSTTTAPSQSTTSAPSGVDAAKPTVCALVTSIALAILLH